MNKLIDKMKKHPSDKVEQDILNFVQQHQRNYLLQNIVDRKKLNRQS